MTTTAAPPATNGGPAHTPAPDGPDYEPLAAKVSRIANRIGTLREDGRVSGSRGFKYATIDQMASHLVPLMDEEGIALVPTRTEVLRSEDFARERKNDNGSAWIQWKWVTEVRVTWLLTDGVTTWEIQTIGKSVDVDGSEKDTNQAHSFARINAYKSIFHLTSGDDPEAGTGPNEQRGQEASPPPPAPAPDPAPTPAAAAPKERPQPVVTGEALELVGGDIGIRIDTGGENRDEAVKQVKETLGGKWMSGDGQKYWLVKDPDDAMRDKVHRFCAWSGVTDSLAGEDG